MRKYGLIGFPLSHSFSPDYFKKKFEQLGILDAEYTSYPLANIDKLPALINEGINGLNVTIPYKEKVMPYLDNLDETSRTINSVNTIKVIDGKLYGYNTDVYGFEMSIAPLLSDKNVSRALVMGTGGSSKAVAYVLKKLGLEVRFVSTSNKGISYDDLDKEIMDSHQVIVNTTPLGMYPKIDAMPSIPTQYIGKSHLCYDLIYNPEKTLFLERAEAKGAMISNGLHMLRLQADKSWQIWNEDYTNRTKP